MLAGRQGGSTDFNRWAPRYDSHWLQRRLFEPLHAAVLDAAAAFPAPATLLDIGCGTGRLLEQARMRWPYGELVGIDAASGMVEVARKRFARDPHVRVEVGTAERLPLPDGSVDIAFSTVSSHHWSDLEAGLREAARVLRPGGRMLLADFHRRGLQGAFFAATALLRRSGERFPSQDAVRGMFEAAGLAVTSQRALAGWAGSLLLTVAERPRPAHPHSERAMPVPAPFTVLWPQNPMEFFRSFR